MNLEQLRDNQGQVVYFMLEMVHQFKYGSKKLRIDGEKCVKYMVLQEFSKNDSQPYDAHDFVATAFKSNILMFKVV